MDCEKVLHDIVVQNHNPALALTDFPYLSVKITVVTNMEYVRVCRVQVTPATAFGIITDDRIVLYPPLALCRIDSDIRAAV